MLLAITLLDLLLALAALAIGSGYAFEGVNGEGGDPATAAVLLGFVAICILAPIAGRMLIKVGASGWPLLVAALPIIMALAGFALSA